LLLAACCLLLAASGSGEQPIDLVQDGFCPGACGAARRTDLPGEINGIVGDQSGMRTG
jgi:hypothetical protein